jgi:DNA (cytosine-5)-methyltransferase 1
MSLTHFSLCTGIGGIDLAAEWAGFTTIGQCEIDDYASRVLEKNFKGVKNFHDIRTVTATRLRANGVEPENITVLSAGFPCQPYSLAGKGRGDGDERDLWGEVARCIGELKPKWFVGENTPGLFARANQRYFKRILTDLTEMGYRVSWGIWGACDVGAPHKRERVFILAHTGSKRRRSLDDGKKNRNSKGFNQLLRCGAWKTTLQKIMLLHCLSWKVPITNSKLVRNDNGLSKSVDRLRCLGNAVVPQQIYPLFRAIAEYEKGVKENEKEILHN